MVHIALLSALCLVYIAVITDICKYFLFSVSYNGDSICFHSVDFFLPRIPRNSEIGDIKEQGVGMVRLENVTSQIQIRVIFVKTPVHVLYPPGHFSDIQFTFFRSSVWL